MQTVSMNTLSKAFIENPCLKEAEKILASCSKNGDYRTGVVVGNYFLGLFDSDRLVELTAELAFLANDYFLSYDLYERCLERCNNCHQYFRVSKLQSRNVKHVLNRYNYYNPDLVASISTTSSLSTPFQLLPLVTFSITTCKRLDLFKETMDTFLNCCTDLDRISRWICIDDNSSKEDRDEMKRLYPFFEFVFKTEAQKGHVKSMNMIREMVTTPYLFHMEDDWKFYSKKPYISMCMNVIQQDGVHQCLINRNYAETDNDYGIYGSDFVRDDGFCFFIHHHTATTDEWDDYCKKFGSSSAYWPHFSFRPSLIRTLIYKTIGVFNDKVGFFEREYADRYNRLNYKSTFLPNIYSRHTGRLTSEINSDKKNAYQLNNEEQFIEKCTVENVVKQQVVNPADSIPTHSVPTASTPTHSTPVASTPTQMKVVTTVINLDRRSDRWELFQRNNSKALEKLNPQRFSAIDGSRLKPTEQLQRIFDGNDYNMRDGIVGCAMSHIKLYTDMIASDSSFYCVLEDDVTLTDNFYEKFIAVVKQLKNTTWDLCYLGHHVWEQFKSAQDHDKTVEPVIEKWSTAKSLQRSMGGTGGYLITKEGARKLLNYINKVGMTNAIDTMQQKAADHMNIYYTTPHLIFSECWTPSNQNVDTDIANSVRSLAIPLEIRYKNALVFHSPVKILNTIDEVDKILKREISLTTSAFFTGSIKEIEQLIDTEEFYRYVMGSDLIRILVIVPMTIMHDGIFNRTNRLERKIGNEKMFNVNEALVTNESLTQQPLAQPSIQSVQQPTNPVLTPLLSKLSLVYVGDHEEYSRMPPVLFERYNFPFERMFGTFETFAFLTEMAVGVKDQASLEKFIQFVSDGETDEGMIVNKNLNIRFPKNEPLLKEFTLLAEMIRNGRPLLFIHCNKGKNFDNTSLYRLINVVTAVTGNVHFLLVNRCDPVDEKYKKLISVIRIENMANYEQEAAATIKQFVTRIRYVQS